MPLFNLISVAILSETLYLLRETKMPRSKYVSEAPTP